MLIWEPEQLESLPPEILEEYTRWEEVVDIGLGEFITKYQVWEEVSKLLMHPQVNDKKQVIEFLKLKLKNF